MFKFTLRTNGKKHTHFFLFGGTTQATTKADKKLKMEFHIIVMFGCVRAPVLYGLLYIYFFLCNCPYQTIIKVEDFELMVLCLC